jgi:hypothetical protein
LRQQQTSDQLIVSAETSALDEAIIVIGTKEKEPILDAYEEHFGQDFDHSIQDFDHSIASKKKSKIEQDPN